MHRRNNPNPLLYRYRPRPLDLVLNPTQKPKHKKEEKARDIKL